MVKKKGGPMSEFDVPEDYLGWYNRMRCTLLTRGIEFTKEEMRVSGMMEIINYEATMDDGMNDDERMAYLVRRGKAMNPQYAVWAEMALKGVKNAKTGETGYINTYSGIVFMTNIHRDIFCIKNEKHFDLMVLPICN